MFYVVFRLFDRITHNQEELARIHSRYIQIDILQKSNLINIVYIVGFSDVHVRINLFQFFLGVRKVTVLLVRIPKNDFLGQFDTPISSSNEWSWKMYQGLTTRVGNSTGRVFFRVFGSVRSKYTTNGCSKSLCKIHKKIVVEIRNYWIYVFY